MTDAGGRRAAARDTRAARTVAAYAVLATTDVSLAVTITLTAYASGGAGWAGAAMGLVYLPAALLAPFAPRVGSGLPRSAKLVGAYAAAAAVSAVVALLFAVSAPLPAIVVVASAFNVCVSVARPTHYAAIPQIVLDPASLVRANSATAVSAGVGGFVGPTVAGLVVATGHSGLMPAVNAVLLVGCAVACLGLRLPPPAVAADSAAPAPGLRAVAADVPVLLLLVLSGLFYLAMSMFEILDVSFAAASLGADSAGQGLLVASPAVGALVGSLLGAGLAYRRHLLTPFVLGVVAAGLLAAAMALVPSLGAAVVLMALVGLFGGFGSLASEVLVNRAVEDDALVPVYAVWESLMLLGYVAGAWVAPVLVAVFGARAAFVPAGLLMVAVTLLLRPRLAGLDERSVFRTDVLGRLRGVRFLSGIAPTGLDRIARTAEWIEVRAGEDVVREGEPGDSYYVVDEGRFDVLHAEVALHEPLAAGDGFGEIALLLDRPRTATVRALDDGRLLRVARTEFLSAVTGDPDGHRVAVSVASAHLAHDGVVEPPVGDVAADRDADLDLDGGRADG